ncbi:RagB/SusD family nutrient uptake outer membrane protein [Sphingobacterium corticibacterium]|uniref:Tetratricopeptide repeat protein n=1 Tax=Sphingobacterium corticibacterium TaxID=2484746 RepID=A0A4Q6XNK0_9SPHI|nr:tetratricopeptide repeat protein [Sphingobacterium corticibacterium]RZF61491.1 tetratricopeptide repeat protein [Sphingobacterium corticibacterium]
MKRFKKPIYTIAISAFIFSSCELTEVTNPYVTEDRFIPSFQSLETWLNGVRRQASVTVGTVVEFSELVSDNYFNNYTQSSKVFDNPDINYFDQDVANIQAAIHKLMEMSTFGLEELIPLQEEDVSQQKAELLFHQAYAHILGAELYIGLPTEALGEVKSPRELLETAVAILTEAAHLFSEADDQEACTLLLARCHYRLGNLEEAIEFSREAITHPLSLRQVHYGTENGPSNNFQSYIFSSTTNSFAPLPRLDFLDPKYFHQTTTIFEDEKPIAIAKAEEAYLILAEALVAQQDISAAKQTLKNLLTNCVGKRPTTMLNDSKETRNGGNRKDYPLTAVSVKFDTESVTKEGLVLDRSLGNIPAYSVSGTHITSSDIDAVGTADEALYLIYLLRQEIFIAEGRRMTDLGIRFPISQREQLSNSHVTDEHTKAIIPDFIPKNRGLDDFTYDTASGVVTIKHDMNRILVQHKNSPYIMPFHK